MRNGKHAKRTASKILALAVVLVLLCCVAVGTTLAYLVAKTDPVVNTFTYGDINITLTETDITGNAKSFKMIPGSDITKDPKVTVIGGSEACWLFVKVEKSANFPTFLTYEMAAGWTKLEDGVYYREVATNTDNQDFNVIMDNKVKVSSDTTKEQLNAIADNYPTLKFTAYAVQKENVADAATAWSIATT